jgi:cyclase
MTNRTMFCAVIAAFYLFTVSALQAQDDVTIGVIPVTDNIYMLTGQGGNIGLFVGKDGTFVVDDQFSPLTDKIFAAIKSVGGETPRYLINTHFHGDHTGGNENLGKAGTLIISHDNVRERLVNGSYIEAFAMNAPPANAVALPVLTFSRDMHFHINDESVKAVHLPGAHTDGDSIIHFENANLVHAGDMFFNGFYPFIDAANGGSLKGTM